MSVIVALIGLLIVVLVAGVVWYIVTEKLLPLVPMAQPFKAIAESLIILIALAVVIWAIIWVLGLVGIHVPIPSFFH